MNRRVGYIISTLLATVLISAGLTRYTLNWVQRPQAFPEPAGTQTSQSELTPTVDGGIPTYDLTLQRTHREVGDMVLQDAYTVNSLLPGPVIRVKAGQTVRLRVKNEMDEPGAIRWQAINLPAEMGGFVHRSQEPIAPGATATYQIRPTIPGPGGHILIKVSGSPWKPMR